MSVPPKSEATHLVASDMKPFMLEVNQMASYLKLRGASPRTSEGQTCLSWNRNTLDERLKQALAGLTVGLPVAGQLIGVSPNSSYLNGEYPLSKLGTGN